MPNNLNNSPQVVTVTRGELWPMSPPSHSYRTQADTKGSSLRGKPSLPSSTSL